MEPSSGDDMEVEVEDEALTDLRQHFDEGTALVVQLEAMPSSRSGYRFSGFEVA